MRNLIIFSLLVLSSLCAQGQAMRYKPNPKAKKLDDSAVKVFTQFQEAPACYDRVNKLLEEAVKIDKKYYEGWSNLLHFQGRTNQMDKCMATSKKMVQLFPNEPDALFSYAVLQQISGHPAEAKAMFYKVMKMYEGLMAKNPTSKDYGALLTQKAILLILMDKELEGKSIIRTQYEKETDPYKKSFLGFYVNKSKEDILEDKIPGH